MILKEPRTFTVDLSALDVGQAFTLQSVALVETYNRIGGPPSEFPSSVSAFLRDPQSSGGTAVSFSGLEPIDDPGVEAPADTPRRAGGVSVGAGSGSGRRRAAVQRRRATRSAKPTRRRRSRSPAQGARPAP